uniref:Uncharacterized protein n=1 Tax=Chromera velia CCMP2878 TaxID=1169474 RepID=A0A0G4HRI4_9ALVE|eukprot:Cvel_8077.t1-p1 / transcript=Cvel_8077.t1 / gene=Cvel_8077 / organism=Chromera_velia_CCMP2878 / gene_product=hypothetical protein / transcript_product=hypothetical protein / location=Cvel_scaffold438:9722-13104(+) / protein_length=174 / sequence_SO=supercontig / SO=protein_coding / is_pseudo=false
MKRKPTVPTIVLSPSSTGRASPTPSPSPAPAGDRRAAAAAGGGSRKGQTIRPQAPQRGKAASERAGLLGSFRKLQESQQSQARQKREETEDRLLETASAMVEIAKQSGDVIKKDNLRLERIKDDQDQHLDQIGKENQLAKSMLWGGPMSFFFEMFLLAIGVIAFLMTFFFILLW